MSVLYYAYGSNLDERQLRLRCPSVRPRFRARLADHRLDFTHWSTRWTGGAADVLFHSGESVWGAVYELCERDLFRLDRYEGGYDRIILEVERDDGARERVVSYTVRQKRSFRPTESYLRQMLEGGQRWRLPAGYLERLRRVPVSAGERLPR